MQALASRRETRKLIMPPAAADNRFRRYGPIESHEVRTTDVTGTEIERLRQRRQMLREMDPEKVKQVIEFHRDLNFFQALVIAQKESKLIVPNDVHDGILTKTSDEPYLRQNYSVWTGTLIIYGVPGKKLGKEVVYRFKDDKGVQYSISFKVPKQFRGLRNCALVIEHPDFDLINVGENEYELKVEGEIRLIESFPRESDWYNTAPETKIPQGEPVKESKDPEEHDSLGDRDQRSREARYLWRREDAHIGPVARYVLVYGDDGRGVDLVNRPSTRLGMALF